MESIRKRLAALSLAALTVLSVPAVSFADESMGTKGDVTGDGKVTAADSLAVLRYVCNIEKLTEEKLIYADFNDDGKVSSLDSLLIQRSVLGIKGDTPAVVDSDSETDSNKDKSDPEPPAPMFTVTNPNVDPNDPDIADNSGYSNGYGDDAEEDSTIYVSGTSYTVPVGMTLYIDGESGIDWGSTNTEIATVDENGLVLGRHAGKCQIIALVDDTKRTIDLTVTPSEAVRTVYASPNSASFGDVVKLIATTDQTRTAVKFDINFNGNIRSVGRCGRKTG